MKSAFSPASKSDDAPYYVSQSPRADRAALVHEQMNALSVIRSVASLLAPQLSPRDRVRVDRLNRAVTRLGKLIRNDFDGTVDSMPSEVPTRIDVELLVREVCERSRVRAEDAGIQLVVQCGGGWLFGDEAALEETLFNLVGSAIDATPSGRAVQIETRVTASGDQVWTVKDSSSGMPARVMLSASVAMSHGGSLAFESRQGEGAAVRMWLPRRGPRSGLRAVATYPDDVDVVRGDGA